jgi:hypothetical protein
MADTFSPQTKNGVKMYGSSSAVIKSSTPRAHKKNEHNRMKNTKIIHERSLFSIFMITDDEFTAGEMSELDPSRGKRTWRGGGLLN